VEDRRQLNLLHCAQAAPYAHRLALRGTGAPCRRLSLQANNAPAPLGLSLALYPVAFARAIRDHTILSLKFLLTRDAVTATRHDASLPVTAPCLTLAVPFVLCARQRARRSSRCIFHAFTTRSSSYALSRSHMRLFVNAFIAIPQRIARARTRLCGISLRRMRTLATYDGNAHALWRATAHTPTPRHLTATSYSALSVAYAAITV